MTVEARKFLGEKLTETSVVLENLGGKAMSWFNGVFPPETRAGKIKQWRIAVDKSAAAGLAWFAKVPPPETRAEKIYHWLHINKPYLAATAALAVLAMLCRFFFRGGGGGSVRMMKAPGRNYRMPRDGFASDPKGYFRDLHARKNRKE